ncbi:MAG TPA: amidohydrolase family protein [Candidatus Acidoferrum sp.]|nr:amidohydrolase family protein [Candidatus Acidoferrum sp.]
MRRSVLVFVSLLFLVSLALGQPHSPLSPAVREFVKVDAPAVVLNHVRVIDGTGAAPRTDQAIVIQDGKIAAISDSAAVKTPDQAKVLDLSGYSVIPGLVGMHNHLHYTADQSADPPGQLINAITFSAPRLYLAAGVTTMRTTGSIEPYAELNLKRQIDAGQSPGPKIDVTAPYLEGPGGFLPQMHELTGPDDARRMVNFWADSGATSLKAYMHITREELRAAAEEAHKRHLKITGHLCSVGFREAAEAGIDNLEHGFIVDTEFVAGKKPDQCPPGGGIGSPEFLGLDPNGSQMKELFRTLVEHHVAITSTLPVFEQFVPGRPPLRQRMLDAMLPEARSNYLTARVQVHSNPQNGFAAIFKKEMELEHAFAQAGGLLLNGPDPSGIGGTLPGFGDQRGVELLVEAGFTPLEAIRISTLNGAEFEGKADSIGSLAVGKAADIVVIHGDPSANINDIEKVELVFKDGVGYDPAKLLNSVRGIVGLR